MGLIVIFSLITILAAFSAFRSLRSKNFLSAFWGVATFLVFGWFSVMTILNNGFPAGTH